MIFEKQIIKPWFQAVFGYGFKTMPDTVRHLRDSSHITSSNILLKNHLRCAIITVAHLLFLGDTMKKIKKYIYPVAFSAIFLILYISFGLLLTKVISFPYGSYAPAAWAVLFVLAWLIFALPIYCIRYSKIIIDEKLKFLFSAYNSLLIIVSHILPFNLQGEKEIITYFILWVLLWNVVPLIWRLISRKHEGKNTENKSEI